MLKVSSVTQRVLSTREECRTQGDPSRATRRWDECRYATRFPVLIKWRAKRVHRVAFLVSRRPILSQVNRKPEMSAANRPRINVPARSHGSFMVNGRQLPGKCSSWQIEELVNRPRFLPCQLRVLRETFGGGFDLISSGILVYFWLLIPSL